MIIESAVDKAKEIRETSFKGIKRTFESRNIMIDLR